MEVRKSTVAGKYERPILYYDDLNPDSRASLMLLKLLSIDVDLRLVNLIYGEQLSDEYKKINPACVVPTLVHKDLVLTGHAILLYICENFHSGYAKQLLGASCYMRQVRIINRLLFDSRVLHRRHADLMTDLVMKTYDKSSLQFHRRKIYMSYDALEAYLQNSSFMAGKMLTLADIAILSTVAALDLMFPIEAESERWKNLNDWFRRMRALPEYAIVYKGIENQRDVVEHYGQFKFPTSGKRLTYSMRPSQVPRLTLHPDERCSILQPEVKRQGSKLNDNEPKNLSDDEYQEGIEPEVVTQPNTFEEGNELESNLQEDTWQEISEDPQEEEREGWEEAMARAREEQPEDGEQGLLQRGSRLQVSQQQEASMQESLQQESTLQGSAQQEANEQRALQQGLFWQESQPQESGQQESNAEQAILGNQRHDSRQEAPSSGVTGEESFENEDDRNAYEMALSMQSRASRKCKCKCKCKGGKEASDLAMARAQSADRVVTFAPCCERGELKRSSSAEQMEMVDCPEPWATRQKPDEFSSSLPRRSLSQPQLSCTFFPEELSYNPLREPQFPPVGGLPETWNDELELSQPCQYARPETNSGYVHSTYLYQNQLGNELAGGEAPSGNIASSGFCQQQSRNGVADCANPCPCAGASNQSTWAASKCICQPPPLNRVAETYSRSEPEKPSAWAASKYTYKQQPASGLTETCSCECICELQPTNSATNRIAEKCSCSNPEDSSTWAARKYTQQQRAIDSEEESCPCSKPVKPSQWAASKYTHQQRAINRAAEICPCSKPEKPSTWAANKYTSQQQAVNRAPCSKPEKPSTWAASKYTSQQQASKRVPETESEDPTESTGSTRSSQKQTTNGVTEYAEQPSIFETSACPCHLQQVNALQSESFVTPGKCNRCNIIQKFVQLQFPESMNEQIEYTKPQPARCRCRSPSDGIETSGCAKEGKFDKINIKKIDREVLCITLSSAGIPQKAVEICVNESANPGGVDITCATESYDSDSGSTERKKKLSKKEKRSKSKEGKKTKIGVNGPKQLKGGDDSKKKTKKNMKELEESDQDFRSKTNKNARKLVRRGGGAEAVGPEDASQSKHDKLSSFTIVFPKCPSFNMDVDDVSNIPTSTILKIIPSNLGTIDEATTSNISQRLTSRSDESKLASRNSVKSNNLLQSTGHGNEAKRTEDSSLGSKKSVRSNVSSSTSQRRETTEESRSEKRKFDRSNSVPKKPSPTKHNARKEESFSENKKPLRKKPSPPSPNRRKMPLKINVIVATSKMHVNNEPVEMVLSRAPPGDEKATLEKSSATEIPAPPPSLSASAEALLQNGLAGLPKIRQPLSYPQVVAKLRLLHEEESETAAVKNVYSDDLDTMSSTVQSTEEKEVQSPQIIPIEELTYEPGINDNLVVPPIPMPSKKEVGKPKKLPALSSNASLKSNPSASSSKAIPVKEQSPVHLRNHSTDSQTKKSSNNEAAMSSLPQNKQEISPSKELSTKKSSSEPLPNNVVVPSLTKVTPKNDPPLPNNLVVASSTKVTPKNDLPPVISPQMPFKNEQEILSPQGLLQNEQVELKKEPAAPSSIAINKNELENSKAEASLKQSNKLETPSSKESPKQDVEASFAHSLPENKSAEPLPKIQSIDKENCSVQVLHKSQLAASSSQILTLTNLAPSPSKMPCKNEVISSSSNDESAATRTQTLAKISDAKPKSNKAKPLPETPPKKNSSKVSSKTTDPQMLPKSEPNASQQAAIPNKQMAAIPSQPSTDNKTKDTCQQSTNQFLPRNNSESPPPEIVQKREPVKTSLQAPSPNALSAPYAQSFWKHDLTEALHKAVQKNEENLVYPPLCQQIIASHQLPRNRLVQSSGQLTAREAYQTMPVFRLAVSMFQKKLRITSNQAVCKSELPTYKTNLTSSEGMVSTAKCCAMPPTTFSYPQSREIKPQRLVTPIYLALPETYPKVLPLQTVSKHDLPISEPESPLPKDLVSSWFETLPNNYHMHWKQFKNEEVATTSIFGSGGYTTADIDKRKINDLNGRENKISSRSQSHIDLLRKFREEISRDTVDIIRKTYPTAFRNKPFRGGPIRNNQKRHKKK